jgi:hypothetical protein
MANEIDILNIQPNKVNASLSGKYVLLYGSPKIGKTTFCATQLPKPLLIATERGYTAIPGVMAIDVTKWIQFKQIIRQLENPAAREKYETIVIDTAVILSSLCEEYVCQQNGVSSLSEIPYGKGYGMYEKEMSTAFRKITMMGLGLVFITHQEIKVNKNDKGEEYETIQPVLDKRSLKVINALVDFILYVGSEWNDKGENERFFYTRSTPFIVAGSRFGLMAPKIPFTYEALISEIQKAMESSIIDKNLLINEEIVYAPESKRLFSETMKEAGMIWNQFPKTPEWNEKKMAIVTEYFGQPIKLSTATPEQQDLVESVIEDLKQLLPSKTN